MSSRVFFSHPIYLYQYSGRIEWHADDSHRCFPILWIPSLCIHSSLDWYPTNPLERYLQQIQSEYVDDGSSYAHVHLPMQLALGYKPKANFEWDRFQQSFRSYLEHVIEQHFIACEMIYVSPEPGGFRVRVPGKIHFEQFFPCEIQNWSSTLLFARMGTVGMSILFFVYPHVNYHI